MLGLVPNYWMTSSYTVLLLLVHYPPTKLLAYTPCCCLLSVEKGGVTYHPNGGNTGDRVNTVERIIIDDPSPSATYTLKVKGHDIPTGRQSYALVITGPLTSRADETSSVKEKIGI